MGPGVQRQREAPDLERKQILGTKAVVGTAIRAIYPLTTGVKFTGYRRRINTAVSVPPLTRLQGSGRRQAAASGAPSRRR